MGLGEAARAPTAEVALSRALIATPLAERVAPNILSMSHWDGLLGGELYAPLSRLDWATMLGRKFDVDVLRCHGCGGRMAVRAVVTYPTPLPTYPTPYVARAILPSWCDLVRTRATRRAAVRGGRALSNGRQPISKIKQLT